VVGELVRRVSGRNERVPLAFVQALCTELCPLKNVAHWKMKGSEKKRQRACARPVSQVISTVCCFH